MNSCSVCLYDGNCFITGPGTRVFGVAVYVVLVIFH